MVAYAVVAVALLVPFAMGECLPRSDPQIRLCDVQKQREFLVYAMVFLANPIVAAAIAWRRNVRDGVIYLFPASLLPFLITLTYGLLENALSR